MAEVTIMHISDTHSLFGDKQLDALPSADILAITGDFVDNGKDNGQWHHYDSILTQARDSGKYKAIIVICGNHEVEHMGSDHVAHNTDDLQATFRDIKRLIETTSSSSCHLHFLIMEEVEVCGLRIHGASWWPGRRYDGKLKGKGSECLGTIGPGIDVLMTHGPPSAYDGNPPELWGAVPELRDTVERLKPGLHIYGHVHEGNNNGQEKHLGSTLRVNSAMCFEHSRLGRPGHLIAGRPGGRFRIIKKVKVPESTHRHRGKKSSPSPKPPSPSPNQPSPSQNRPSPSPTTINPGTYTIENVNAPGKCINVDEAKTKNGARLVLWDNPGERETKWRIAVVGPDSYTIESVNAPGKFINVDEAKKKNGAKLVLWDNPEAAETQWKLKPK